MQIVFEKGIDEGQYLVLKSSKFADNIKMTNNLGELPSRFPKRGRRIRVQEKYRRQHRRINGHNPGYERNLPLAPV